ncbi:ornithine cyclodeaminase [Caulobacter sp. RL271]|uniref:Ornithine cyclodeaminase n=1 Tax=Caulobacter segnis TaxID=88688 RepID=A0ABY5A1K2_9CAUL|nr:ornithine cyclodeaminase [Caulobacter segnis]USQ98635.1 ornithine cyclodeaminase [Caulobacter segnis]
MDVDAVVNLVERIGLETVLTEMAGYVEEDYQRWGAFEKSPRLASHSADGVIELMPTSDGEAFAFKYVNGHPTNVALGLQTVVGFGVLASVRTGYPELIAEMTITTALRTAATSAMAARHLARDDAATMAIIGLGAQSEFQAHAFRAVLGVRRLRVYDVDPAATRKFITNMQGRGFEIFVAASASEAVMGADIITTVTADKAQNHILSDNMVGAGVHLNAVGGDCPGKTELQADILRRGEVFVEFAPQTRIEGEIQQLEPDFPVTELWRVVSGQAPGRRGADQITIFDSVGFAIEDFSALRYLRDRMLEAGDGARLNLLASPEDPRDLFGLLTARERLAAPVAV